MQTILFPDAAGVILADKPTSMNVDEVLVNPVFAAIVPSTICNTLPAGNCEAVIDDALVTIVPVSSGSVSVRFVEVAGLSIVKVAVPVLAPEIAILLMALDAPV
jgi:hypothetical protein